MNLTELAKKHGTDKLSVGYMPHYDKHFAPFRGRPLRILELGVLDGASLRMWAEYFPNAEIWGVDVNPKCKRYETDRIKIVCSSQDNQPLLQALGEFDIVIDDASHLNQLILASAEALLPQTRMFYVIEDLRNSYGISKSAKKCPGCAYNRELKYHNERKDMDAFFHKHLRELDFGKGRLKAVHFYSMICFMEFK